MFLVGTPWGGGARPAEGAGRAGPVPDQGII